MFAHGIRLCNPLCGQASVWSGAGAGMVSLVSVILSPLPSS
jgi:hypothetical protein